MGRAHPPWTYPSGPSGLSSNPGQIVSKVTSGGSHKTRHSPRHEGEVGRVANCTLGLDDGGPPLSHGGPLGKSLLTSSHDRDTAQWNELANIEAGPKPGTTSGPVTMTKEGTGEDVDKEKLHQVLGI